MLYVARIGPDGFACISNFIPFGRQIEEVLKRVCRETEELLCLERLKFGLRELKFQLNVLQIELGKISDTDFKAALHSRIFAPMSRLQKSKLVEDLVTSNAAPLGEAQARTEVLVRSQTELTVAEWTQFKNEAESAIDRYLEVLQEAEMAHEQNGLHRFAFKAAKRCLDFFETYFGYTIRPKSGQP